MVDLQFIYALKLLTAQDEKDKSQETDNLGSNLHKSQHEKPTAAVSCYYLNYLGWKQPLTSCYFIMLDSFKILIVQNPLCREKLGICWHLQGTSHHLGKDLRCETECLQHGPTTGSHHNANRHTETHREVGLCPGSSQYRVNCCNSQEGVQPGPRGYSILPCIIFQGWRKSPLLGGTTWQREQLGSVRGFPHQSFASFLYPLPLALLSLLFSYLIAISSKLFFSQAVIFTFCVQFSSPSYCRGGEGYGEGWEWGSGSIIWSGFSGNYKLGNTIPKPHQCNIYIYIYRHTYTCRSRRKQLSHQLLLWTMDCSKMAKTCWTHLPVVLSLFLFFSKDSPLQYNLL